MRVPAVVFALAVTSALVGCAGARPAVQSGPTHSAQGAAPVRHLQGEAFTIVGRPTGDGDAYDATMLFDRATQAMRDHHCDQAVAQYDQLVREFPTARAVPVAYFNRGICLQALRRGDDAIASFREAVAHTTERDLTRDAWFRVATVATTLEPQRPAVVVEAARAVLALPRLSIADRVEALAREATAVLAQGDRPGATRLAEEAVALAPTAEAVSALDDDEYIAQARFVIAEATRVEGTTIAIDVTDAQLEAAIERRVDLVMHAHVQFNDAIRVGNVDWAAASGFRIGEMYGDLYNSIVNARVPDDWDEHARAVYRRRTSTRLRPLLTGAMRAWEATLAMARRNGIEGNEWVRRADQQLQALRDMILNDGATPARPAPPSGAPTPTPAAPSSTAPGGRRAGS